MPPSALAKSGLNSTAIRIPTQFKAKPNNKKAAEEPTATYRIWRPVIEIDFNWPVGPASHKSCMIFKGEGGGF